MAARRGHHSCHSISVYANFIAKSPLTFRLQEWVNGNELFFIFNKFKTFSSWREDSTVCRVALITQGWAQWQPRWATWGT